MNISFQGIKNGGAAMYTQDQTVSIKQGPHTTIIPKGRHVNLHLELNDEGNKDLNEFKYILKAFHNKFNDKAMNLEYDEYINPNTQKKERSFIINNQILEVNDDTFPVFHRIYKFLKRIEKMPDDQMKVENAYLTSPEVMDAFYYYKDVFKTNKNRAHFSDSGFDKTSYLKMIDEAHTPKQTKLGAKYLSKRLEKAFSEYFLSS